MESLPVLLLMLLVHSLSAQTAISEKSCISFVAESASPSNIYAKDPLRDAVMLSNDFEFFADTHEGCWSVRVISLPVVSAKGRRVGYAISHTVTDPKGMEVGHSLAFGPDSTIFIQAMHKAAAEAIRNIRLARSSAHPVGSH